MAFPQFGYPPTLPVAHQGSLLLAAAAVGGNNSAAGNPAASVAPSRPSETTPRPGGSPGSTAATSTGAQCPCYPPRLLASYPRMAAGGLPEPNPAAAAAATAALYGGAYPPGYLPIGTDPTSFMNPMCGDLKAGQDLALLPGSPYFPGYDLAGYPYSNGFALDPNARRKNATRESTTTLKAWLSEHRKNPYPTKGEKIMLAIITKMTLTQVSTWFANARRRLKKDNKVTWSPRNRGDDDDDDDDDVREGSDKDQESSVNRDGDESDIDIENDDIDSLPPQNDPASSKIGRTEDHPSVPSPPSTTLSHTPAYAQTASHPHSAFTPLAHPNRHPAFLSGKPETKSSNTKDTSSESNTNSIPKAKIWSLAEVASSKEESKSADSAKSDAPAYVTRGPMQEPFLDSAAKPPHPGFSAFRPMIGAPRPAMAGAAPGGLPAPWGHFAPSHPHPAYSYALSQHYWAMSMARSNGLSPEVAYSLSSRLSAPVPSEMKHQEIDSSKTESKSPRSSRSCSPVSPTESRSRSPIRPPRHSVSPQD